MVSVPEMPLPGRSGGGQKGQGRAEEARTGSCEARTTSERATK